MHFCFVEYLFRPLTTVASSPRLASMRERPNCKGSKNRHFIFINLCLFVRCVTLNARITHENRWLVGAFSTALGPQFPFIMFLFHPADPREVTGEIYYWDVQPSLKSSARDCLVHRFHAPSKKAYTVQQPV